MTLIRTLGFAYFALFRLDLYDAALHLFSGLTLVPANLPHLAIGGFAAYDGFVLSKRHGEAA